MESSTQVTQEKPQYKKAYVDLPHFNAERKLSSCLKINEDADRRSLYIEMQKGEPEKTRVSGKYNATEIAYIWARLGAWLTARAMDELPQ